jgi:hypothetical protein
MQMPLMNKIIMKGKHTVEEGLVDRKVHSEIKFDDSEGLCLDSEVENDVEI